MTVPTITLTPRKPAVLAGFPSTVDVLVRIGAPESPPTTGPARSALHLAIVIDRSGSMAGQPLEEAKKAAAFLISGLTKGDLTSLVTYDNDVQTRVSLRDVADRETFHRAISAIQSGGQTDLHGGWFAGAETLAPAVTPGSISRVILLSDGCANHGLTEPAAITRQCTELAGAGVTTSTYGLGQNFNEELMISMARAGRGNNYYGQTAEDLMDPFREEFALLNATCARRVELILSTVHGVTAQVLNGYPQTPDGHWQLPDLAYGGEAWALVRLKVSAQADGQSIAQLLSASIRYVDMGGEPRALQPFSLSLPAVHATVYAAIAEDELVVRRATELDAARLLMRARSAAGTGNWDQVKQLLEQAKALGAENPWLRDVVAEMQSLADREDQDLFMKEGAYSSSRMTTRLAAACEGRSDAMDAPAFLRRKTAQGKKPPPQPGRS
jgi:Ca-activated chloride channel family protein